MSEPTQTTDASAIFGALKDKTDVRLTIEEISAASGPTSETTGIYGLDNTIDPLTEMAQLAHAIEMPPYPWSPQDAIRVLDRGRGEIQRLRDLVREMYGPACIYGKR